MNQNKKHFYIYNGMRYDDMKDCCQAIGIKSGGFKHLLKYKIVEKIIINQDTQKSTNLSKRYDAKKEKTQAKF